VIRTSSQPGFAISRRYQPWVRDGYAGVTFLAGEPIAPIGLALESISKDGGAVLKPGLHIDSPTSGRILYMMARSSHVLGNATAVSEDADAQQPGFQVAIRDGRAAVTVEVHPCLP
jgi:hypothetical protein